MHILGFASFFFPPQKSILYKWLKLGLPVGGTPGIVKSSNAGASPQTSSIGISGVGSAFVGCESSQGVLGLRVSAEPQIGLLPFFRKRILESFGIQPTERGLILSGCCTDGNIEAQRGLARWPESQLVCTYLVRACVIVRAYVILHMRRSSRSSSDVRFVQR